MNNELRKLFDDWGQKAKAVYTQKQWLLSKWEVFEGITWPEEKIEIMIDLISRGLELSQDKTFVDLGCGGGWILKTVCPKVKTAVGLDFSLGMLQRAKEYHAPERENIYICGDISQLPFQSESFDRVLSYFVFLNFMDDRFVERALLEVYRIMKKDAIALIGQLPDKDYSRFYDQAKEGYLLYCQNRYGLGESHREVCRAEQKLFDRKRVSLFLDSQGIVHRWAPSFNPFWRPGEDKTVNWRYDLILKK